MSNAPTLPEVRDAYDAHRAWCPDCGPAEWAPAAERVTRGGCAMGRALRITALRAAPPAARA